MRQEHTSAVRCLEQQAADLNWKTARARPGCVDCKGIARSVPQQPSARLAVAMQATLAAPPPSTALRCGEHAVLCCAHPQRAPRLAPGSLAAAPAAASRLCRFPVAYQEWMGTRGCAEQAMSETGRRWERSRAGDVRACSAACRCLLRHPSLGAFPRNSVVCSRAETQLPRRTIVFNYSHPESHRPAQHVAIPHFGSPARSTCLQD